MDTLEYLETRIADLDRAIEDLAASATNSPEEATLHRLVEVRDQFRATLGVLDVGRVGLTVET